MVYVVVYLFIFLVTFGSILLAAPITKYTIKRQEAAICAAAIALAAMSPAWKLWLMVGVSFGVLKYYGGEEGLFPMWIVTVALSLGIVGLLAKVFVA